MNYVLIKMPSGEIKIEDNSSPIGRARVEKLCIEGGVSAGNVESDLHQRQLRYGISYQVRQDYEAENEKLQSVRNFIDGL